MAKADFTQNGAFILEPREIKLIALFNGMDDDAKIWVISKCVELADVFPFKGAIEHKQADTSFH